MRFAKFLSMVSLGLSGLGVVGLSSAAAMAQESAVPLKNISSAALMTLSGLSQTRLPFHKHISCTQIYQNGQHVFTDCQDSDGYGEFSNKLDYGWQQDQPACAISIEEPVVRFERDPGLLNSLFGTFLESDIKVDGGELLQLEGGFTSLGNGSIELEANASDGNKVQIKCFNPNASNEDLNRDLSGILEFRSIVVKIHAPEASSDSSDAAAESAESSELSTGSDAHPADGTASNPVIDSSDVISLERAH